MPRRSKYDWPNDEKLQALLDEHGTVETARRLGCPPSSLSNRIRQRGLTGSKGRRDDGKQGGAGELKLSSLIRQAAEDVRAARKRVPEKPGNGGVAGGTPQKSGNGAPPQRVPEKSKGGSAAAQQFPSAAVKRGPGSSSSNPRAFRRLRRVPALLLRLLVLLLRVPVLLFHAPGHLRRVPSLIWQALAIVSLAALAGLAAFVSVSNDPTTYERESSFAIRPNQALPPAELSDVTGTLAQPDSAVTVSIVDMLGSGRVSGSAAQAAGIPESSVGESGTPYLWSATRRPGSTVVDIRLTGPSDDKLLAMQNAVSTEAPRLVEQVFPLFRLESLSTPGPRTEVGPKVARTVGLALLLGALLGITLILLERKLRSSLGSGGFERGGYGRAIDSRRSELPEGPTEVGAERVESGER